MPEMFLDTTLIVVVPFCVFVGVVGWYVLRDLIAVCSELIWKLWQKRPLSRVFGDDCERAVLV